MKFEIGSEFWSIPKSDKKNTIFPPHTNWYLSGTSALYAIIMDIKKHNKFSAVGVPSWCCECMIHPFLDCGVKVLFYPVVPDPKEGIRCDFSEVMSCDALLVMDYFGYRSNERLPQFSGIFIRDLTHSVFCGEYTDSDYYFGSLRKWAGFWTGGFAWKQTGKPMTILQNSLNSSEYVYLRKKGMQQKSEYIKGVNPSKAYLKVFEKAEDLLDNGCIGMAEPGDINAAEYLAVSDIIHQRRRNAEILLEAVSDIALFPHIGKNDCPLFVPICLPLEQRNVLKKNLIEESIYCPVHW